MKKCILWVRCSTTHQEIDSQLKETREYAQSLGFDTFEIIGEVGASAYKVNKLYMEMVNKLKSRIETDKTIEAVVVWHLNRLSRSDKVATDIKEFLIEHKIQLHVKEPSLRLLNSDGTVNEGAEMIFNIFSTLSKQQISELRVKVKRAKRRDKALHKYIGGPVVAYGYRVDEETKQVVPDVKQAEIVNTIYDLYGTGEYSYTTLVKEINERYGTDFPWRYMRNILAGKKYFDNTKYPPIITELQYRKAEKARNNSVSRPMTSKYRHFANRLIACPICGRKYTGNARDYRCTLALEHKERGQTVSIANMDGLLWLIASHLESQKMLNASAKEEYIENKAVLSAKIDGVAQSLTRLEKRAERGKRMCLNGLIEIEEYKAILKEVEAEGAELHAKVNDWKAQIAEYDRLINEDTMNLNKILTVSDHITGMQEQEMRNIVRRWIRGITFTDDRVFEITALTRVYRCRYNRYGYESRWYTLSGKPIAVKPYIRDKDGARLGNNRCGVKEIPVTLAWLGGSEIV